MTDIKVFDGQYSFLSNFSPSPIFLSGFVWPTVEHYFQAMKTDNLTIQQEIRALATPGQTKKAGRKVVLRPDWDQVRLSVMAVALREKFKHPSLREQLLDTGERHLEEGNWWGDTFWGVCRGKGQNNLGKLLMRIREEISRMSRTDRHKSSVSAWVLLGRDESWIDPLNEDWRALSEEEQHLIDSELAVEPL